MSLEDLRKQLSGIDRRFIELVAERQRIVSDIGRHKQSAGAATRDYAREKDVLDMGRKQAQALGIDPDLAETLLRKLITTSLESQERDRVIAEGRGDGRRALVIGGAGKMGGWFTDFFQSQGFATTIADPGVEDGPGRFRSWTDAGVDYDVIVVAAPLAVSGRILAQLAVLKPAGLVFDIGSLKSPLIDGLTELQHAGCQVASLHPMFGPDTRLLSGKHLIVCDVGCQAATAAAKDLFSSTRVEQLDLGLDDHCICSRPVARTEYRVFYGARRKRRSGAETRTHVVDDVRRAAAGIGSGRAGQPAPVFRNPEPEQVRHGTTRRADRCGSAYPRAGFER